MKANIKLTKKPIMPIISMPIPVTFAITLNSSQLGFFEIVKILLESSMNFVI